MAGYEFTKKEFRLMRLYVRNNFDLDKVEFNKVITKYKEDGRWLVLYGLVEVLEDERLPTERQNRIERLSGKYSGRVYYSFWGIDCDLFEATYAYTFENEFVAQDYIDDFYNNAEGQCSARKISKKDYEEFETFRRDHAAEQMGY